MIEYAVHVYKNGSRYWFIDRKFHREDGPAVESADGDKRWYLNIMRLTEEEFNQRMNPVKEMTIEEIQEALGHKVKVVE